MVIDLAAGHNGINYGITKKKIMQEFNSERTEEWKKKIFMTKNYSCFYIFCEINELKSHGTNLTYSFWLCLNQIWVSKLKQILVFFFFTRIRY